MLVANRSRAASQASGVRRLGIAPVVSWRCVPLAEGVAILRLVAALGALAAAGLSSPAAAKDSANDWHFRTAAYVFMPDIDGKQSFPAPQDIHVDFSDLLNRTEFSFVGVFEARYQRMGAFADIIYLDLGDEKDAASGRLRL